VPCSSGAAGLRGPWAGRAVHRVPPGADRRGSVRRRRRPGDRQPAGPHRVGPRYPLRPRHRTHHRLAPHSRRGGAVEDGPVRLGAVPSTPRTARPSSPTTPSYPETAANSSRASPSAPDWPAYRSGAVLALCVQRDPSPGVSAIPVDNSVELRLVVDRHQSEAEEPRDRDDPRRGVAGAVRGAGSGGVEPGPLSGHGGCNRRECGCEPEAPASARTYLLVRMPEIEARRRVVAGIRRTYLHLQGATVRPLGAAHRPGHEPTGRAECRW
jgi:hypothetical protein